MPAKPPILDDRVLQDILQRLQGLSSSDLPEWKPPLEGDAGTMLQRIYARLMEIAIQRLNQAPEKNLLAFLDTMGVNLLPPSPARAPLTFSLTPGTPATLVSHGTQAVTKPAGQQPAVVFETEDDLTVLPAQVTIGFTMDPIWDRYTDQTAALGGQSPIGFTPFVGTKAMPHILYLGDELLLNFSHATTVEVKLAEGILSPELRDFFRTLLWQYRSNGVMKTIAPVSLESFRFVIPEIIDQEIIQGVGLPQGASNRWLRTTLITPFPDALAAHNLMLSGLTLELSANNLLPDLAFNNTAPLDVTKEFLPFGETPKTGDTFYIGNQEALSKPGAAVTLHVQVRPSPPPTLAWEYWSGNTWTKIPRAVILNGDGTNSFTREGASVITLPRPPDIVGLFRNDINLGTWFRVRIDDGSYRGVPRVEKFALRSAETTLAVAVQPQQNLISLSANAFAKTDDVLLVRDEFVQVVAPSKNVYQVAPFFLNAHEVGTPVLSQGLSSSIGTLIQAAQQNANQILVNTAHDINPGDVLLMENSPFTIEGAPTDNREFIRVKEAKPILTTVGLIITTVDPLRFNHPQGISLRQVTSPDFMGFADGEQIDFTRPFEPFFPFSELPGPGSIFYFGSKTGFPPVIRIDVDLRMTSPNVQLAWEFFGTDGWQPLTPSDTTNDLIQNGAVSFNLPTQPLPQAQVNNQNSWWIRARLSAGNYGLPIDFIAVDPDDPKLGFKIKPKTGSVNPPVLTKLTLSYQAERSPVTVTQNGFLFTDQTATNEGDGFTPFVAVTDLMPPIYADPEPSFYFGLDAVFPEQPVVLYIAAKPRAFAGSVVKETRSAPLRSSSLPPLLWEYFNGTLWRSLTVFDNTGNLTESGTVEFLTPVDMASLAKFDLIARYWIRARSSENDPTDTQKLLGAFLNTIPAIQAATVVNETLGSSNGQPGQILRFARTPVLSGQQVMVREAEPPSDKERQAIEAEEGVDAVQELANPATGETEFWVRWHAVPNFLRSEPYSRHYILDHTAGLITFGNGQPGLIPPRGTNNITATYRAGGGAEGNAAKAAVVQIKSPVPGVAAVTNPIEADGGSAVEGVAMVEERGPQTLRHFDRAVSSTDLEWLARQAAGTRVARAKCLSNVNPDLFFEPGWATLLIVPQGTAAKLAPGAELIREVEDYLESRAFVGLARAIPAHINVMGPGYIQVSVQAEVVPLDIDEVQQVKQRVITALAAFFHPLTGGPGGTGWEFGRDVYISEVCQVIESLEGVSFIRSMRLTANIAQHRLDVTSPATVLMDLPEGSIVMTTDRRKAALLAEPSPAGTMMERVAIKGFKEGDRIARVLDVKVSSVSGSGSILNVTALDGTPIQGDAVGFPRGSLVKTLDGTRRTRLALGIPPNPAGESLPSDPIVVEDSILATVGDVLTLFYPFPMTITSVAIDRTTGNQILGIEPYETVIAFPAGSGLATLDNRVRMPLALDVPVGAAVTSLQVSDFAVDDRCIIARRDGAAPPLSVTIGDVRPVFDIVYLDNNFLISSGVHQIVMVADNTSPSESLPRLKRIITDEPG